MYSRCLCQVIYRKEISENRKENPAWMPMNTFNVIPLWYSIAVEFYHDFNNKNNYHYITIQHFISCDLFRNEI